MYKVLQQKLWAPPRTLAKILLIMRLTTIILIAAIMQVSASTFAQKITLRKKNAPLTAVFNEIRTQTGYDFLFTASTLKGASEVNIDVSNMELKNVLEDIFKDQPLEYRIENKSVIVSRKETSFLDNLIARFQTIDVRGRVVDEKGEPLVGASVSVKGGRSTTTDKDGNFYLARIDEKAVLVISFIGYLTKEVDAVANLSRIQLELNDAKLDEIQVIAYGTTTKRFSTSNIGTISAEEIARQSVTNPLLALQGRVPGLFINQTTGQTAGNVNVVIQGVNSLRKGTEPFYVVDGIPYSPQFTSSSLMGTNIVGQGGSTFNFINPSDIESITILKDADATAIYGSRAANGAILITTKKGKPGQTKVDIDMRSGWGKITRRADLLNTQQYLDMRREAYKNDNLAIPTAATNPTTTNFDLTIWDQNQNHDWQDELVGGTASYSNLQANVSGGNEHTQFLAGTGYNKQGSVYPGNLADQKYNVHVNINHRSENKKFSFMLNANYLQDQNEMNQEDLMSRAITLAPNAPDLYNADGSLNWGPYPKDPNRYSFSNPLALMMNAYSSTTENLLGNALFSYDILPGLTVKSTLGYNTITGDEMVLKPIEGQRPDIPNRQGSSSFMNKYIESYIIEPQITYIKNTKFGNFDFLLGSTFQQTRNKAVAYDASGFSNNAQLSDISSATSLTSRGGNLQTLYRYNAIFGRVNYRVNDKYIINLTARRDGSSRFGEENKLHNFYSVGGAWLFGDEEFVKSTIPFLSTGKLRVNYGTTGNDQIGDYEYASLLQNFPLGMPYQNIVSIIPFRHNNPFLQWEETGKFNIGLDFAFISDKVALSANYFRNRSSNQLIDYQLPFLTGFALVTANFPATLQNSGLEMLAELSAVNSDKFDWRISVNATIPRNKLVEFKDLENSPYASQQTIGEPSNIQKVYQYGGVNPETGTIFFNKQDGTTTASPNFDSDRFAVFDPNPKWYGGLSNTLSCKGFQLDFLFQYVSQTAPNSKFSGSGYGLFNQNVPTYALERWQQKGDLTDIAKFSTRTSFPVLLAKTSDAQQSDASFLRLKNASFSYTLPGTAINKIGIKTARIYISGQNLLTVTNYIGTDPETHLYIKLPPLRMYTAGLQVIF